MALLLKENHFREISVISEQENPDVVIINTCTVTGKAEAKCRNSLHKIRRIYPQSCIVMCGCMIDKDNMSQLQDADILLENRHKNKVIELLKLYQNGLLTQKPYLFSSSEDGTFSFSTEKMSGHSRAFMKIQDGCNNFCTYCKIPFARGRSRSRPLEDILKEAKLFEKNGYREVILTGINISDYHTDEADFPTLLKILLQETSRLRFRLSSLEPQNLTPAFFDVIQEERICPHFHMALQSGSTKILKLMNRKYSAEDFITMIEKIRQSKTNPFLSTDLILGFPGETENDFHDTLCTLEKANFSFIHVFSFSPRPNTKAFTMKPKVPERVRDNRVHQISSQTTELTVNYARQFQGKILHVLIERKCDNFYHGKSENYLDVRIETEVPLLSKEIYSVIVKEVHSDGSITASLQ